MRSWISHKSKIPAKSVPAAEILAAGESIDEGNTISSAYSEIVGHKIELSLCVDSKEIFTSVSTQRNSIDKSIRADVASIRFEFQTRTLDKISWIPGRVNLADPLKNKNCSITDLLQLILFTGRLSIYLKEVADTKITNPKSWLKRD